MTSARRVGRIIGMLLLVHLATGLILPYVLLLPVQASFLETAAGMEDRVRRSVLLLFVGGAVPVGISIAVWPIIRERSYRLGLWLLAISVVNFTLQIIENSLWLTMLSVSRAYAEAGAAHAERFQSLAVVVISAWKWEHYSHIFLVVGWLFTLYWLAFRCGIVPRALAAIGMLASMSQFIGITLPEFAGYSMPFPTLFGVPLGLANLVLAVWLMSRGFKEPYVTAGAEGHGVGESGS